MGKKRLRVKGLDLVGETAKAYKVSCETGPHGTLSRTTIFWLPKSQVEVEEKEVESLTLTGRTKRTYVDFIAPEWLVAAKERELGRVLCAEEMD